MPAKTHGDRRDRLEQILEILAERRLEAGASLRLLEQIVTELATETRRGFDQLAQRFNQMGERMDQMAERMDRLAAEDRERVDKLAERMDRLAAEDRERAKTLDERVDKLVLAIGEFIRAAQHPPR